MSTNDVVTNRESVRNKETCLIFFFLFFFFFTSFFLLYRSSKRTCSYSLIIVTNIILFPLFAYLRVYIRMYVHNQTLVDINVAFAREVHFNLMQHAILLRCRNATPIIGRNGRRFCRVNYGEICEIHY